MFKFASSAKLNVEKKFKIELNKELTVNHLATTVETTVNSKKARRKEVSDPEFFESLCCYLNFDEDLLQFEFCVETYQWQQLSNVNERISIEKLNRDTHVKTELELPNAVELSPDTDYVLVNVDTDFKDVLLDLFSEEHKEFKLKIKYTCEFKKFETTFNVVIPSIEQTAWNSRIHCADFYNATTTGGVALVKLFKNNFSLSIDYTQEEADLRCKLQDYINATTKEKINKFDFLKIYKIMMVITDLAKIKEMEDFSLTLQRVSHYSSTRLSVRKSVEQRLKHLMCQSKMKNVLQRIYIIEVTKNLPYDAQSFDYLYVTDMQDYQQYHDCLHEIEEERILGKIRYIFGDFVLFEIPNKSQRKDRRLAQLQIALDESRLYHIQFQPNRIPIRIAHQAIDTAITNKLSHYLNYSSDHGKIVGKFNKDPSETTKFDYMNPSVASNKEQKLAVKNIFNRTSFPSPYIVFGPPGTGKSTTIVEAIAQIVNLKPNSRILVTAGSNSACDDIGNRLLKYISVNKILRLYSPAFDFKPDKIDKVLQPISNFRNRHTCDCKRRSCPVPCFDTNDPSYEEFYTARVIIGTLVSCGRIFSAGVKSNHFDYIFIDEAASECEQHTLIPIAGLGSGSNGVTAQIVMSGDHKQLGPIITSKFCCKMGMEKSMMERIMETNVNYQRGSCFNSKYVTQLVKNYRSHPAILQFSNDNFYDSKLQYKCPKMIADFACGWNLLKNGDFPLLFHSTRTRSTPVGLSLMNEGEVNVLSSYIEVLLMGINGQKVEQSDIGIISPYRAQRDRMSEHFSSDYPEIEIGTVDSFQGREKKIIVMSTVRSGTRHVGFLRNEKRLNVALTRAKCLLIIIGNSETLQKCVIWNKFIAYCDNNNAIVGDASLVDKNVAHDQKYEGNEERPEEIEDEFED